jgi:hypothetical protein
VTLGKSAALLAALLAVMSRLLAALCLRDEPSRDFGIGGWEARPADKAGSYFDRYQLASGVERSKLSKADQRRFDEAREDFVRTCLALYESPEKQALLDKVDTVAFEWASKQAKAGKVVWNTPVPAAVFRSHGIEVRADGRLVARNPEAVAARVPRARESSSGRRRRGDSTSRGGASGDKPRSSDDDDPHDHVSPALGRASRRGAAAEGRDE